MNGVLILGEAPGRGSGGLTRRRVSELAGRPWEEWADWLNLIEEYPGAGRGKGTAWNVRDARRRADEIQPVLAEYDAAVLLGRRVAQALIPGGSGFPFFRWTDRGGVRVAVSPHTSGIVRFWNEAENVARARTFYAELASQEVVV